MYKEHTDTDQDIICHCSGTTAAKIRSLASNNLTDLAEISRKTGAVSGCGGCESQILALIAQLSATPTSH